MAINKTINKSTKTHGAMRNCLEYVLKEQKILDGYVYMVGPAPEEINAFSVYKSFIEEKEIWNKDSGRMYNHNVISFHKDENITPEQALEFGKEFAEKWFSGYQSLISVHQDKDHIHIHLVTNTVSYENGYKLHNSRGDLQQMKEFTNELCMQRGLTIAVKGHHFDGSEMERGETVAWTKDKYNLIKHKDKNSYVVDCAIAVSEAMEKSFCKDDFELEMEERGWHTTWTDSRKHITFENDNGEKVRDTNLSKTFSLDISKEGLINEFERNKEIRLAELEAERDRETERKRAEQLNRYYAEVEAAIYGNGFAGETVRSPEDGDGREGLAFEERERRGSETDIGSFLAKIDAAEQDIGDAIEASIRDSRAERRAVVIADAQSIAHENQSIADAEQRRIEEQKRLDAERRAAEIERRAYHYSGPSR